MRWKPAPARRRGRNLGFREFPAAGKTGTAYDFTEALFAGYDSAITCAVRAGFDKPQKIYRGAFGREIALPVWVDVMNASVARYPAKEIAETRGGPERRDLLEVRTARDGQMPRNTTYREFATKEQMPTDPCSVHGDPRARIVRDLPDAGVPRAALAVDTAQVKPVPVKGPTLLADNDPYNAVKSTVKPAPAAGRSEGRPSGERRQRKSALKEVEANRLRRGANLTRGTRGTSGPRNAAGDSPRGAGAPRSGDQSGRYRAAGLASGRVRRSPRQLAMASNPGGGFRLNVLNPGGAIRNSILDRAATSRFSGSCAG